MLGEQSQELRSPVRSIDDRGRSVKVPPRCGDGALLEVERAPRGERSLEVPAPQGLGLSRFELEELPCANAVISEPILGSGELALLHPVLHQGFVDVVESPSPLCRSEVHHDVSCEKVRQRSDLLPHLSSHESRGHGDGLVFEEL